MTIRQTATAVTVAWVALCSGLIGGCGGVEDVPAEPTAAIVVVGVIDKNTQDFLDVPATVIVGGVRGTATVKEGSVVLRDVPFGTGAPPTQPMAVTARGYKTEAYPVQISVTTATFVTAEMTKVDLETTGIVAGRVTEESTGAPVVSAAVSFESEQIGGEAVVVNGYTDRDGYYIVGGIPIGRVVAGAAATGYVATSMVTNIEQAEGSEEPQTLDFVLVGGDTRVAVTGRTVDVFTQQPISGAAVTIDDMPSVQTDANGAFSIRDVFVGQRMLVVKASGYDDYRENIEVVPGMASVVVQMNEAADQPPGGPYTISGTVTLIGAAGNAGAEVEVFDVLNAFVAAETVTDAAGGYGVLVLPGTYEITVRYLDRSISRTVALPGGGQKLTGIDFTLTVN